MPGISLLHGDGSGLADHADSALESLRFFDDYGVRDVIRTDRTILGYSGYPGYPVRTVETDDAVVALEGHLYDVDDVEGHLARVAEAVRGDETGRLSEWVGSRDGDFLVVVYLRDRDEVYVVNDAFCRLPTYFAAVDGTVLVSRELKFVREMARRMGSPLEMDRLGAAQQLLFGYTLGERTVFDGVRSLPPGSKLDVDGTVSIDRLYRHQFDRKAHADRRLAENAANLADRFTKACADRDLGETQNVISLSGGLDSRAVAGAFDHLEVPCVAATFNTDDGTYDDDARIARAVAADLGFEWEQFVTRVSERNYEAMLEMKQGMNYLGMTFILDFFEQLRERYGTLHYLTGDGGDKVLVDLTPPRRFGSVDDLVDYVIQSNSRVPLEEAAAVANVHGRTVRRSVEDRLRSYPEVDLSQKYAHFMVRERGFNFLNQGEDRNRYYFWSSTPFYSLPVFEYAMNCPDEQKRQRDLYIAFLERFSPDLLEFEYPNFGAPITSAEYRLKRLAYDFLARFPTLHATVVDLVTQGANGAPDVAARIQSQVEETDVRPLSKREITAIAENHEEYGPIPLNYLFTLTSLVRDLRERDAAAELEGVDRKKHRVPQG